MDLGEVQKKFNNFKRLVKPLLSDIHFDKLNSITCVEFIMFVKMNHSKINDEQAVIKELNLDEANLTDEIKTLVRRYIEYFGEIANSIS